MRNLKKFLALVLATLMVVSASAVVSADFTDVAAESTYATAINDLAVKGIIKGNNAEGTTFGPEDDVTREQMALFIARAATGVLDDAKWATGLVSFEDVDRYFGAIQYCAVNGIINGTTADGKVFNPKGTITYAAALKMAVCALGFGEGVEWNDGWGFYNVAVKLGLTEGVNVTSLADELNRAETAQIIYNMLYTVPANGGQTMAEKNFAIATPDNVTTFVITATPKQFYFQGNDATYATYKSLNDVNKQFVGVQKLVAGIPSGSMLYVEAADLGIEWANVEDYFHYSVDLVNYNEETGDFDAAILGAAPTVLTHNDFTYNDTNPVKFVASGVTYTAVDAIEGATKLNEIVVLEANDIDADAKVLNMGTGSRDNIVYDKLNNPVAKVFGKDYLALEENTTYGIVEGEVYSESKILEAWGIKINSSEAYEFAKFDTVTDITGALKGEAFEIAMFDDDKDGVYERAFYTPVYVGVYNTFKDEDGEKFDNLVGVVAGEPKAAVLGGEVDGFLVEDVTYSDKAAAEEGTVVVFTFNKQLKTVEVKEILELQIGELDKVNAKSYKYNSGINHDYGTIILTIDGTEYKYGYANSNKNRYEWKSANDTWLEGAKVDYSDYDTALTDGAVMGATVVSNKVSNPTGLATVEEIAFGNYDALDVLDVEERSIFGYAASRVDFVETAKVGETYGFYAYNGVIIMISEVEVEDVYDFAVIAEDADINYALDAFAVDMYIGDELVEGAEVVEFLNEVIADLSNGKFMNLLSTELEPGQIWTLDTVDEAYALTTEVTYKNYHKYDLLNAKVAADTYLAKVEDFEAVITDDYPKYDDNETLADAIATEEIEAIAMFLAGYDRYLADNKASVTAGTGRIDFTNDRSDTTDRNYKIRTNSSTVIYVIETDLEDAWDTTVDVFKGVEDDSYVAFDADTQIWVDTVGYGSEEWNGVTSVMYIIDPTAYDFEGAPETTYVLTNLDEYTTSTAYGEELDLPADYCIDDDDEEIKYFVYEGYAIDLNNGEKMDIYSVDRLTNGGIYEVDEYGVVCDENHKADVERGNLVSHGKLTTNDKTIGANGVAWTVTDTTDKNAVATFSDDVYEDADSILTYAASWRNYAAAKVTEEKGNNDKLTYADWKYCFNTLGTCLKELDEIALYNEIFDEITMTKDGYYCIEIMDGANTSRTLIDEDDEVTEILVVDVANFNTVLSGDDAIAVLETAPWAAWIGDTAQTVASGKISSGVLFTEFIDDGSILFLVNVNSTAF